jgi:hypothetical protein
MAIVRDAYQSKWRWVLTGILAGARLGGALTYRQHHPLAIRSAAPDGAYCESGIGAAKGHAATALVGAIPSMQPIGQTAWIPRINDPKAPEPAPLGMTWIPGGQFWMEGRSILENELRADLDRAGCGAGQLPETRR